MKHATVADVLEGRAQWCVVSGKNDPILRSMPDKAVDVVISDPPYAPRAMKNARSNKKPAQPMTGRREGKVHSFEYEGLAPWERISVAQHFARLAERWVVVWTDIESDEAWRRALVPSLQHPGLPSTLEYIRTGVWVRTNPAPQMSGDRPGQGVEACVVTKQEDVIDGLETYVVTHAEQFNEKKKKNVPKKKEWNGGGHKAVYIGPIVNSRDGDRRHTSPKPLWLMLRQVLEYSNPGDLILDPYCGYGTTGVAAVRHGRRFIGVEKNEAFAADARARIAAEQRGLSTLAAERGQTSIFDILASTFPETEE